MPKVEIPAMQNLKLNFEDKSPSPQRRQKSEKPKNTFVSTAKSGQMTSTNDDFKPVKTEEMEEIEIK